MGRPSSVPAPLRAVADSQSAEREFRDLSRWAMLTFQLEEIGRLLDASQTPAVERLAALRRILDRLGLAIARRRICGCAIALARRRRVSADRHR